MFLSVSSWLCASDSTLNLFHYAVNRQSHIFLRERIKWSQVQQNKRKIVCGRGARGKWIVPTLSILDARYRATRRHQVRYTEAMEWLTVKQAAEILQITPLVIYRLIRQGRIPAYRYGTAAIRLKRDELFQPIKVSDTKKRFTPGYKRTR